MYVEFSEATYSRELEFQCLWTLRDCGVLHSLHSPY